MKAIALEAGLDPVLVERAAHLIPVDKSESLLDRVLGAPLRHRLDAHFTTKLTEERSTDLLSLVRVAAEQQGEGDANATGMFWKSVGEGSETVVTVHNEGEGTRVRVQVDRRGALVITAVLGFAGSVVVVVLGLALGETILPVSAAVGLTLTGAGVAGVLALARGLWTSTSRRIWKDAKALMDTISRSLAETGGPDPL